jgi:monofunctional biosynthetic peptidoglycan transglycosylase
MARQGKKKRFKKIIRKSIRFGTMAAVFLILATVVQVAVLRYINPPFTLTVVWETVVHRIKSQPYKRPVFIWRPMEAISPHLQRAVMAAEDQRFPDHLGFDLIEIQKAAKDILRGRRFRGASTISMQTSRTVFLLPVRNIFRKTLEAYYTVLIELMWNKRRILEVYLNTVDWGTRVMGAEAACLAYFKKHAADISPRQAALLAAILPKPHRYSPVKPEPYVRTRAKRILADMKRMPKL